jgi:hypothetical protein
MLTPAESLKDTWASIFRRRGRDGNYTRLFDNLDAEQKNIVQREFSSVGAELPVVASVQNSANWFVMTTERLIWSINGNRGEIAISLVEGVMPGTRQRKREMSTLLIKTPFGGHLIELEPGSPLVGVWSILLHLSGRNRKVIAS